MTGKCVASDNIGMSLKVEDTRCLVFLRSFSLGAVRSPLRKNTQWSLNSRQNRAGHAADRSLTIRSSGSVFLRFQGRNPQQAVLYLSSHRLIFEKGSQMLQNNVEMDLKMRLIESGQTQTEVAEKLGVSLSYVNRITKGREQIVNKTFVKMMDELGYDVEITYKKKAAD